MLLAVVVFWAVGAYTRLTRLRLACVQMFGAMDSHFAQMLAMLSECHVALGTAAATPKAIAHAHSAVHQTAYQFGAALVEARGRPLHVDTVASLNHANESLDVAWQALVKMVDDGGDVAHIDALQPWRQRWAQHQVHNQLAVRHFNAAIDDYNAAIAQFPATVLAWMFGFRPARGLQILQAPSLVQSRAT